jgi:hypothetical protein
MATHAEVIAKVRQIWGHGIPMSNNKLVEPLEASVVPYKAGMLSWSRPKCHMCGRELGHQFLSVKTVRGKYAKMCVDLRGCGSFYVKNQAKIVQKVQDVLNEGVEGVTI